MKKRLLLLSFSFCLLSFTSAQNNGWKSNLPVNGYLMTEWHIAYWDGTAWGNSWKYLYTYDGNKNLASTTEQDWVDTSWINQFNYLYSYDSESRMVESLYRKWEEGQWLNDDKEIVSYDSYGNILSESKYTWISSLSDWLEIIHKDYVYDVAQNMTEWKIKKYTSGSLIDSYKMIYFYDGNNNLIESIYTISNDGIIWKNNGRYLGQYDQNNNLIESISQEWNGSLWRNEFKMTYQYDTGNRQIRETIQYNDSIGWLNTNQYLYAYDISGNMTEHIKQNWGSSDWLNYEKYAYQFNGSNDLLVKTYYLWNANSWEYFNIEQNTFDEHENLVETLFRDWVSGTWNDRRLDKFTYVFANEIVELSDLDFNVYPNPAEESCKVQGLSCSNKRYEIDMSDIFGRKVLHVFSGKFPDEGVEINLSMLPAGIYFCRIISKEIIVTKKIVKL